MIIVAIDLVIVAIGTAIPQSMLMAEVIEDEEHSTSITVRSKIYAKFISTFSRTKKQ